MSNGARKTTVGTADVILQQLADALAARGLRVDVSVSVLTAVNPAADTITDPRGQLLNPGLSQRVLLQADGDGLRWCWMWPGPERGSEPELEPMVPAEEIDEAARRIGNVLRIEEPKGAER